jgi:aspartate racemase
VQLGEDGRAREPLEIDPRVLEASARLGAWADFLVIVANTPHLFVDEIAAAAGRPVLSMVDLVVEELERRGDRPVGLLGLGVPQAYVDRFARERIDVVTAPRDVRAPLDEAILRMLEGITTGEHRAAARAAVAAVREAGAAGTVLGCTEIPLLLGEHANAPDLVDPARLLARAAVRRAVG